MRGAARIAFAAFLAVGTVLLAHDTAGADGGAAPKPSPAPSPAAKRLRFGPYVDPYGPVPADRILDVPRFDTRVEVHGKAMDRVALTARMEWWMRDFEPMRGAVSRAGSAPSIEEMKDHRHHPPDAINVVPILDWLLDKLNKKP
jgi:hypothetical protein